MLQQDHDDYIYTRKFASFDAFWEYMKWATSAYNTKIKLSLSNYMKLGEFQYAMLDEDFMKNWVEKRNRMGKNTLNY
jgi:hypothetical protein